MTANQPLQLPWRLLLLDLIGTLLIAVGLYELFTPGTGLLPGALSFPCHEWALIAAGLAVMLPAVSGLLVFLARARRR
jgi:hypothetical protein